MHIKSFLVLGDTYVDLSAYAATYRVTCITEAVLDCDGRQVKAFAVEGFVCLPWTTISCFMRSGCHKNVPANFSIYSEFFTQAQVTTFVKGMHYEYIEKVVKLSTHIQGLLRAGKTLSDVELIEDKSNFEDITSVKQASSSSSSSEGFSLADGDDIDLIHSLTPSLFAESPEPVPTPPCEVKRMKRFSY